jgi:hypothetical protein
MWAKYVAGRRFVVGHRRFRTTYGSQRQGSSIPRMTLLHCWLYYCLKADWKWRANNVRRDILQYAVLMLLYGASKRSPTDWSPPYLPWSDTFPPLPPQPSVHKHAKGDDHVISFACNKRLGFDNTGRVGCQRGIQASLVLRDFPLTRLENLYHFFEFTR